jgi:hypothetical protein
MLLGFTGWVLDLPSQRGAAVRRGQCLWLPGITQVLPSWECRSGCGCCFRFAHDWPPTREQDSGRRGEGDVNDD